MLTSLQALQNTIVTISEPPPFFFCFSIQMSLYTGCNPIFIDLDIFLIELRGHLPEQGITFKGLSALMLVIFRQRVIV